MWILTSSDGAGSKCKDKWSQIVNENSKVERKVQLQFFPKTTDFCLLIHYWDFIALKFAQRKVSIFLNMRFLNLQHSSFKPIYYQEIQACRIFTKNFKNLGVLLRNPGIYEIQDSMNSRRNFRKTGFLAGNSKFKEVKRWAWTWNLVNFTPVENISSTNLYNSIKNKKLSRNIYFVMA